MPVLQFPGFFYLFLYNQIIRISNVYTSLEINNLAIAGFLEQNIFTLS
jgi:hypothetical protein